MNLWVTQSETRGERMRRSVEGGSLGDYELHHGDCLEVMASMEANTIDAIVTDPPAGISFMGAKWDEDRGGRDQWISWMTGVATEALRVIKPGGHALVWALPRTSHWTATAWEDAGWELRDRIGHLFGTGFPKSHNVSKALDKMAGAERKVVGVRKVSPTDLGQGSGWNKLDTSSGRYEYTAPATDLARQWDGWGTALKPAVEDWYLLRKPLDGTVAANVAKWGTGAINIDGCRVGSGEDRTSGGARVPSKGWGMSGTTERPTGGRYPAHILHDGSDEVLSLFPETGPGRKGVGTGGQPGAFLNGVASPVSVQDPTYDNRGSAARYFYCAKASKRDREEGVTGEAVEVHRYGAGLGEGLDPNAPAINRNHHPTVKPQALMTYLCRLITPPSGLILDPFTGSGSTGKAAMIEGFRFVGIEQDAEYIEIARQRIEHAIEVNA